MTRIEPNIEKKFRSKTLLCGCCGMYFRTWKGYEDQDQDRGYGICSECQNLDKAKEQKILDDMVRMVGTWLNKKNREKWAKLSEKEKETITIVLEKNGLLPWKINYRIF